MEKEINTREERNEGRGGCIDFERENITVDGRCNKWMNKKNKKS